MGKTASGLIQCYQIRHTDRRGQAVFDYLPPGEYRVERTLGRMTQQRDGRFAYKEVRGPPRFGLLYPIQYLFRGLKYRGRSKGVTAHYAAREVGPGLTVMKIAGAGRPVVGRLVPPPDKTIDFSRNVLVDGSIKRVGEEGPAGPAITQCDVRWGPDGSFRAEDVGPGRHRLVVHVASAPPGPSGRVLESLGSTAFDFTVGEIPDARSAEPLDLGNLVLRPPPPPLEPKQGPRELNVGDIAPAFETQTLDGQVLRLADYRGKYVLLTFWSTWCSACPAEVPELKAVFDAFGNSDRFVMMGLGLDDDAEAPKEYVAKHGMNWVQGFLGKWRYTSVPAAYGVPGIPATFLIGPDGRVAAKKLYGGTIRAAVAKALNED